MKIKTAQNKNDTHVNIFLKDNIDHILFDEKNITIPYKKRELKDEYYSRVFFRKIIRTLKSFKVSKAQIDIDNLENISNIESNFIEAVSYEFLIANYEFNKYKTNKESVFFVDEVVFLSKNKISKSDIKLAELFAKYVNKIKDIANTPASDMHIPDFIRIVKKDAKNLPVKIKILTKKELEKEKAGAILAVGSASKHEPKMLVVEYMGDLKNKEKISLVGKGVVYDTGGLGLKPAEYMVGMHMDMTGAIVGIYTALALSELGSKVNVVAIAPLVENAIGSESYRQSDVIMSRSGKTIEVKHTDAEGRLILADALSYAQDKYKPKRIIDIATLTGAAVVAIGEYSSAVFSNNPDNYKDIIELSRKTSIRVWPLPLFDEHKKDLQSKIADIANVSNTRYGGASTAAAFLSEFIEDEQNWVHIDIAPRMESSKYDNLAPGSVGEPFYLLVKLLNG